ncbi:MAG: hypothetical protein AB7G11_12555 [Phycisphaerales bacterium]
MIQIRREQMVVLEESVVGSFVARTKEHLREHFPRHFEVAGEERVERVIRMGISRGKAYGVTQEEPLRVFVERMLMHGACFDEDGQLPWARELLMQQDGGQFEQMGRVQARSLSYLDEVEGPEGVAHLSALRKAQRMTLPEIPALTPMERRAAIREHLNALYPSKAKNLGGAGIDALGARAAAKAAGIGLASDAGSLTIATLMMLLGDGFLADPVHDWAGASLAESAKLPERRRLEQLLDRSKQQLRAWFGE